MSGPAAHGHVWERRLTSSIIKLINSITKPIGDLKLKIHTSTHVVNGVAAKRINS